MGAYFKSAETKESTSLTLATSPWTFLFSGIDFWSSDRAFETFSFREEMIVTLAPREAAAAATPYPILKSSISTTSVGMIYPVDPPTITTVFPASLLTNLPMIKNRFCQEVYRLTNQRDVICDVESQWRNLAGHTDEGG